MRKLRSVGPILALLLLHPEPASSWTTTTMTSHITEDRPYERILDFDTHDFPLHSLVADALGCSSIEELGLLHEAEPEDYALPGSIRASHAATRTPLKRIELLRRALTDQWKRSRQKRQWEQDYLPELVRSVVGPQVMPAETQLIYQRAPMLRFHVAWPLAEGEDYDTQIPPPSGRNPGTLAGLHTDAAYGHPKGERNFFLPVTTGCYGTNSLWVEGMPDRGDFQAMTLQYGQIMLWNGHQCRHCSPRNISNQTRISFDFRVIPGSEWQAPSPEDAFQLGNYYIDALAL